MLKLDVRADLKRLARGLDALSRDQIPFAASVALNKTAFEARQEVREQMPKYIDRPTPWALRSVRYTKSTKRKLEASVWFDPWGDKRAITAEKFLGPQIFGGPRTHKAFEKRLRAAGILPGGRFAVPAAAAPLDKYGNVPGRFFVQVLSRLGASGETGFNANETATSRARRLRRGGRQAEYFVGGRGRAAHLRPGIYQRVEFAYGSSVRPVLLFVTQPRYRERFPFLRIVNDVHNKNFDDHFMQALAMAIRTAR